MTQKTDTRDNLALPFLLNHEAIEKFLREKLSDILALDPQPSTTSIQVKFSIPDKEMAQQCLRSNITLMASLAISCAGDARDISLSFPYPIHGVFIFRSGTSEDGRAERWIWHPRMVGRPGVWSLKRYTPARNGQKIETSLRIVYPDGSYSTVGTKKTKRNKEIVNLIKLKCYEGCLEGNCPQLLDVLTSYVDKLWDQIKAPDATLGTVKDYIKENSLDAKLKEKLSGNSKPIDEQDIGWQRLNTFPAFLIDRVITLFAEKALKFCLSTKRAGQGNNSGETSLWNSLCELDGRSLVSFKSKRHLLEKGMLHYFDPINGLDALSRLSSFQRYNYSSGALARLPASFRQNHPGFKGLVCPVETPESKKVGITLHLSRNARADILGRLHKIADNDPGLGFGASLIPFYEHNDGPRAMMGAKNMKQALPIKGAAGPAVTTGHEDEIKEIISPLMESGILPDQTPAVPGVDLLVAYMPWYGWNMEDAIVVGGHLIDPDYKTLDYEYEREFSFYIKPGYQPAAPEFAQTFEQAFKVLSYEDENNSWMHKKDIRVTPDTPLIFFKDMHTGRKFPVPCGGDGDGILVERRFHAPAHSYLGGLVSWKIRYTLPLGIGDKLMGRYGNKGVVSRIEHPGQMPRLPDDKRLPPELYGRAVDIILNPHGVISRMNLGQLMETQTGLLHRLSPDKWHTDAVKAVPFGPKLNIEKMRKSFLSFNRDAEEPLFDKHGRIHLILPGGKRTSSPVTVGFQHFLRLNHIAAQKAHVRGASSQERRYPYNLVTGQPVGGKKKRGGQRIGEMEFWALAANGAHETIKAVLGPKSDPAAATNTEKKFCQTFQAIRDHLFACGIDIKQQKDGSDFFEWLSFNDVTGEEVSTDRTWKLYQRSVYKCPKENCYYSISGIEGSYKNQNDDENLRLCFGDLLRHYGVRLKEKSPDKEIIDGARNKLTLKLEPVDPSRKVPKTCTINNISKHKRSIHFDAVINRKTYHLYSQIETNTVLTGRKISEIRVVCKRHKTQEMLPAESEFRLGPVEKGLCDNRLFGNIDISRWDHGKGGYIVLPSDAFKDVGEKDRKKHLVLNAICLQAQKDHDDKCRMPVLPLKYRYSRPSRNGSVLRANEDPFTRLYRQIILSRGQNNKNKDLPDLVKELSGLLERRLFGKYGLLRREGLGRRVDMSGRLVIVPDPTLDMDECGVPVEALMVLLGPAIAADAAARETAFYTSSVDRFMECIFKYSTDHDIITKDIEKEVFQSTFWDSRFFHDPDLSREHLHLAFDVIKAYMDAHPEINVLLNRQPSLHRYSMMAFRPVPLPYEDGQALRIHPLVCKGFGADFDGDEMAIHMPLSDLECAELDNMKPSRPWNLISVANSMPMPNIDQDIVSGHFYISLDDAMKNRLREIVPCSACGECSNILQEPGPWKKDHAMELLKHLCEKHADDVSSILRGWVTLAFKACTEAGQSFGFLELEKVEKQLRTMLSSLPGKISSGSPPNEEELKQITDSIGDAVVDHLEGITKPEKISDPGFGFAALAASGARGRKQTRQIACARGFLSPGATGFPYRPEDFFIPVSLVSGMTPDEAFLAAMNARSSMMDKKLGTGKAGYLTRRLVLILWDWVIINGDCGLEHRNNTICDCNWADKRRICSACYGPLPGYKSIPDNFPAGLIAAQSFGERGTQLAMQSFHTGEKALSVDDVVSILNGKDPANPHDPNLFDKPGNTPNLVKRLKEVGAYENLDKRHLELIWLAIHTSKSKTLNSAWKETRTPVSGLVGPGQKGALLNALKNRDIEDYQSSISRIMTCKWHKT